jgi:glutamyl-tRNA synthetase
MAISLVLRGDDHLSNTPKQILLYQALGLKAPGFGHIPLIHDEEGHKISKRKEYQWATGTGWYEQQGFMPEAFVNYLARLCWSDGTDNEFWTLDQLEKKFGLKGIASTPARFDFTKLKWFNGKYIRELFKNNPAGYWTALRPFFVKAKFLLASPVHDEAEAQAQRIGALLHDRLEYFAQLEELAQYFYTAPTEYSAEEIAKAKVTTESLALLRDLIPILEALPAWEHDPLDAALREYTTAKGVKFGDLVHPLRLALTGSTASPGIFDVLLILGRADSIARVRSLAEATIEVG